MASVLGVLVCLVLLSFVQSDPSSFYRGSHDRRATADACPYDLATLCCAPITLFPSLSPIGTFASLCEFLPAAIFPCPRACACAAALQVLSQGLLLHRGRLLSS